MPNDGLSAEQLRIAAAVVSRLYGCIERQAQPTSHWLHDHYSLLAICIPHLGSSVYVLPTPHHLRPLFRPLRLGLVLTLHADLRGLFRRR